MPGLFRNFQCQRAGYRGKAFQEAFKRLSTYGPCGRFNRV